MDALPPSYINSPTNYVQELPKRYEENDVILHLSYNILLPQEIEEYKRNLSLWINSEESEFSLCTDEQINLLQYYVKTSPSNALSGPFASKIKEQLNKGNNVLEAAEVAFEYLGTKIAPRYLQHARTIEVLESNTQDPEIRKTYQIFKETLRHCGTNPRENLQNYLNQRILPNKDNDEMLDMLLIGSIGRNPSDAKEPSPLRNCDYWQERKIALFQAIDNVSSLAPNASIIMAFQEILPSILDDFKAHFDPQAFHIISYNNGTGKKVDDPLVDNSRYKDEFTSTLILSKDFDIIREELGRLPSTSSTNRRILGVELLNNKTGKHLAVFTAHTCHIPSKEIYENTTIIIHEFVEQCLKQSQIENLAFVFSGDLNAFTDKVEATYFIENLSTKGPFEGSHDFRETNNFHCPRTILHSTFLGQQIDDYKAFIGQDGTVQPNALDHSFLSKELSIPIWGMRDAGVYDDNGNYVDPYENQQLYIDCLKKRQTASDHFLNAFILKQN